MNHTPSRLRRALVPLVLSLASIGAAAQAGATPRSYSVLSELARELLVITFQPPIGSNAPGLPSQPHEVHRIGALLERARASTLKVADPNATAPSRAKEGVADAPQRRR